jgi:ABC-2 type transport system ATP-binding protein
MDPYFFIFLIIVAAVGTLGIFAWNALSGGKRRITHITPVTSVEPQLPFNLPIENSFSHPIDPSAIISTSELRKTFVSKGKKKGTVEAVRGISFSVNRGEVFGLLGPNGAGKTTTMRMLCTLLTPTSGNAVIAGHDIDGNQVAIRRSIGYVSQAGGMQRDATGRENVLLQAKLYNMSDEEARTRTNELLQLLHIEEFADRKTVTYSGGQRRIFDLACGIVHRPDVLFLDEPSTGLDPQNRAHVWEQIKKLQAQGTTIVVTTHYLDEADALCNRVAIVDTGLIVAIGSPEELKQQIGGDAIVLGFTTEMDLHRAKELFAGKAFIREMFDRDMTLHIYVERGEEYLPEIVRVLHEEHITLATIKLARPSLDDVFLKITGRSFEENLNS